jgi:hypothetical protein
MVLVDFFEKSSPGKRPGPGGGLQVFWMHDRIHDTQKNIQEILHERPAGVCPEHFGIQGREGAPGNVGDRRRVERPDSNRPTLRRAPGNGSADDGNGRKQGNDSDELPMLKRRD